MNSMRGLLARAVVLLLGLFVVPGCIPFFLHAGYTARDRVTEPRLGGVWVPAGDAQGGRSGDADTLMFEPEKDGTWRVTVIEGGREPDSLLFLGHLFRAGGLVLIDLEPHPTNPVRAFYLPAHTFWTTRLSGDTLFWGGLDEKWVVAAAGERVSRCPVDTVEWGGDQNVVLTCDTPSVRRLLERAASDPRAFWIEPKVRMGSATAR